MPLAIQSFRGVTKNYGDRGTTGRFGGRIEIDNLIKTATWTFDATSLPAVGLSNLEMVIPANSTIISARLRVITAFVSSSTTTDLDVGLSQKNGTAIDVDGLMTAVNLTQTVIGLAGSITSGTGALIGKTIGAVDGELLVTPNVADLVSGRGELIVQFMTPAPLPAS